LFESGSLTGLTDRDLVERASGPPNASAEAAFEALVTRHGPMVLRVCRNVLGCHDDAEDAFQATFLVLVKQRQSIRKLDSVASWLYGVASRVAARARVDAARRRNRERRGIRLLVDPTATIESTLDPDQTEHAPIVQEEVRRLPEKYRSVVLLCYWEGLTQEQAAHHLGCPIGTVRSRVARARDLLRVRLARRGLTATAGALAFCFTSSAPAAVAPASLPLNLVRSTVQAAMWVAAGTTIAGVVSASVLVLVRRMLWSFTLMKIAKIATVSAAVILVALGAQTWAQRPHRENPTPRPSQPVRTVTAEKVKPVPTGRELLVDVIGPPDLVLVEVLEALPGRPISGDRLVRPDGTISLGWYGNLNVAGMTPLEVKEKVILHLRKYLSDDSLGLIEMDGETGNPKLDKDGKQIPVDPKDSDRVFVDVTAYNNRCYYVEGEVTSPGRLPFTGSERVLDVMHYAGGPLPSADLSSIKLIRTFPKGSPVQVLPINYEEITVGTDDSTNYEIMPFDRIAVPRAAGQTTTAHSGRSASPASTRSEIPENSQLKVYFDRKSQDRPTAPEIRSLDIQHRLDEMEKKLDSILKKLEEPDDRRNPRQPLRGVPVGPGAR
jgi:RNA polymerase sigma factor (sigma-70 family)